MLSYSVIEICRKANKLTRKYGTSDPEKLCCCMGINLMEEPLGTDEDSIKGLMVVCNRIKTVMVNSDLPEVIRRFLTAHELGHAVLHSKDKQFSDHRLFEDMSGKEKEANFFAAELLLGDSEALFREMKYTELNMFQMAASHRVPYELLAYKLEIMEEQGYDVPELPYEPDARFLAGTLGMENTEDRFDGWGN